MKLRLISETLLVKVLQYLARRPYDEVAMIIGELQGLSPFEEETRPMVVPPDPKEKKAS